MSEFFKTNTTRIAQLCYKDISTDNWIPITEATPIPVGTPTGSPLSIRIIGDTGEAADVVLQPDGTYALRVDSEMTLNVDNVTIGNINVGRDLDSGDDTKLATTVEGFLRVVDHQGNPVTDIRQLTTTDSIKIYGSDDGITARLIRTKSDGTIYTTADAGSIQKVKAENTKNQDYPLFIISQNDRIESLLLAILQQVEITNRHLSFLTEEEFDTEDTEFNTEFDLD